MDRQNAPAKKRAVSNKRKPYQKPRLVVHGTVADLTQAGGVRRRDGINTRAPS
ncbi:MAG TPA: lasso RiPP family leader peptide-containing protein [Polyangiaceae bacterium]|nr:lasso RiPP family leader peptide-containing protein [Polyangiaceae bacterium]HMR80906.1 lasso RiPP family leader peptide-containing protein [Polyangiaceae bacterium]